MRNPTGLHKKNNSKMSVESTQHHKFNLGATTTAESMEPEKCLCHAKYYNPNNARPVRLIANKTPKIFEEDFTEPCRGQHNFIVSRELVLPKQNIKISS